MSERTVQAFIAANAVSPVVSGAVIGAGGQGAHYTLEDGKRFKLSRDDCAQIGMPKWKRP